MLTAELKLNGKVIGTFEATRLPYKNHDTGRPAYQWKTQGEHPTISGIIMSSGVVESHDPSDWGWELVRKALSRNADHELVFTRKEMQRLEEINGAVQDALAEILRTHFKDEDEWHTIYLLLNEKLTVPELLEQYELQSECEKL